jgi:hypothetical protein
MIRQRTGSDLKIGGDQAQKARSQRIKLLGGLVYTTLAPGFLAPVCYEMCNFLLCSDPEAFGITRYTWGISYFFSRRSGSTR